MKNCKNSVYKKVVRPILFKKSAQNVHEDFLKIGQILGSNTLARQVTDTIFNYQNPKLQKTINGIQFPNPVGLAAGFDYNGQAAVIMKNVGFGFNTVGTITAKTYAGNKNPQLVRLPHSEAILVNKGFKSDGVYKVAEKLKSPLLKNTILGASVGSSNIPEVNSIELAIDDYVESFSVLKEISNIKYFELNISCPNTSMTENFTNPQNYKKLLERIKQLNIKQPIFVKMPNELEIEQMDQLVKDSLQSNINSFIFSNLVKNRENANLEAEDLKNITDLIGNLSGRPTHENALKLVKHFRNAYGKKIVIVGCGGIFCPEDAKHMFDNGADLVQLITGMVFEGPGLIGDINRNLV